MEADDGGFAVRQVLDEIFDLVGVGVRRAHFHRRRQVDDDGPFLRGAQGLHDLVADADGEILFRARVAFGRVFVADVHAAAGHFFFRQPADEFRPFHGDVHDTVHVLAEHDFALQRRRGIIEMDDDVLGALHGLEGLFDQLGAGLDEDLQRHVVRHQVLFNQGADDVVFRFRRGREPDFDFLEADIDQRLEHAELLVLLHGCHQGLVAVAQVDAAPYGCLVDDVVRPVPVLQMNLMKRNVLFDGLMHFPLSLLLAQVLPACSGLLPLLTLLPLESQ